MKILWVSSFKKDSVGERVFLLKFIPEARKLGTEISLFRVPNLFNPLLFFRYYLHLSGICDEFDAVHAQWGSACGLLVSFLRCRKVLTLRGSDWYGNTNSPNPLLRVRAFISVFLTKVSLCRFDTIICMSNRMKLSISKLIDDSKIIVLYDPIDLEQFTLCRRQYARDKLGFPKDSSPWILFATAKRNNSIKRPLLALRVFEKVQASIPSAKFFPVTGLSRELMALYMNASNVLLLTSTHEGWPNIVKESLACGTPFVSTDVSDLHQWALNLPDCYVSDDSVDSLASRIVESLHKKTMEGNWVDRQILSNSVNMMNVGRITAELNKIYMSG